MMLLKLAYMLYFIGCGAFTLNSVSSAMFANGRAIEKVGRIGAAIIFSMVWPIAIMSRKGRSVLLRKLNNL